MRKEPNADIDWLAEIVFKYWNKGGPRTISSGKVNSGRRAQVILGQLGEEGV